ncbi:hypothetical protein IFR05_006096, partial [Cadophora sp. M221]
MSPRKDRQQSLALHASLNPSPGPSPEKKGRSPRRPRAARSNAPSPPILPGPFPDAQSTVAVTTEPPSNGVVGLGRGMDTGLRMGQRHKDEGSSVPSPLSVPVPGASPEKKIMTRRQRAVRSNAPSPSLGPGSFPFPIPFPDPSHEISSSAGTRARAGARPRARAPRTFRSSAPSPGRSLSMSCTSPAEEDRRGIVPPANTPVKFERGGEGDESTSSEERSVSSSSTVGGKSDGGLGDDGGGEEDDDGGEEDDDGGEEDDEESEDGDEEGYNPALDPTLQEMYRQSTSSVTKTVSVTNTPVSAPTPALNPTACNRTVRNEEDEEGKTWNPPLAPKAMKSHMITWINDKKVGERINGVQVPVDDEEEG